MADREEGLGFKAGSENLLRPSDSGSDTFTPMARAPAGVFTPSPPIVGGYHLGGEFGISFHLLERPGWFHRLGVRLVLGWKWEDE